MIYKPPLAYGTSSSYVHFSVCLCTHLGGKWETKTWSESFAQQNHCEALRNEERSVEMVPPVSK